jgi:hypothetical protein
MNWGCAGVQWEIAVKNWKKRLRKITENRINFEPRNIPILKKQSLSENKTVDIFGKMG